MSTAKSTLRPTAGSSAWRAARKLRRTRLSTGAKPRSSVKATVRPPSSTVSSTRKGSPLTPSDSGSRGSCPTMADSISAASVTVRAIGPSTDSGDQPWPRVSVGIRPGVGRKPTMPQ